MSLKQVVEHSLRNRVGPDTISNIDVFIQRSVIALQRDDLLPPRIWEFKSKDYKQEKRLKDDDDTLIYNFYYLPEDFRKLDEFRPYESFPYAWTGNEHEIFKRIGATQSEEAEQELDKKFSIIDTHHDDDSNYEKQLIALPFPDDDEFIRIKYYVNGKNLDWDWIGEEYWEAIIGNVEKLLGLRDPIEVNEEIGRAVSQWKEQKGHNNQNETAVKLSGSFFGRRRKAKTQGIRFNDGKRNR